MDYSDENPSNTIIKERRIWRDYIRKLHNLVRVKKVTRQITIKRLHRDQTWGMIMQPD